MTVVGTIDGSAPFDVRIGLSEGVPDFLLEDGDLALDLGLETAVLLSIFTDAEAEPEDELPDGSDDRRGWWAADRGVAWGSRFWLTARRSLTPATVALAVSTVRESLQWLVDSGVAESVEVDGTQEQGFLALEIELVRGAASRWARLWASAESGELHLAGVALRLVLR